MVEPQPLVGFVGCDWPIDTTCMEDEWTDFEPEVQARSLALAAATLRRLTGYRVGGCPVTIRPCFQTAGACGHARFDDSWGRGFTYPYLYGGLWYNSGTCGTCQTACEVALPGPVGEVYEVKVDGAVVSSTKYVVDGNLLVWRSVDPCPWNAPNDLSKPDTAVGTFSVRYLNAYPVDGLGAEAATRLAIEYARACMGNDCQLPPGVTTIVRQGVTMDIASGAFPDGVTGIREVDTYVALWNPEGLRQQPKIWSPDLPRVRH